METQFFEISKNGLNNMYMVHSRCAQIIPMYKAETKKQARQILERVNQRANQEAQTAINKGLRLSCEYPKRLLP